MEWETRTHWVLIFILFFYEMFKRVLLKTQTIFLILSLKDISWPSILHELSDVADKWIIIDNNNNLISKVDDSQKGTLCTKLLNRVSSGSVTHFEGHRKVLLWVRLPLFFLLDTPSFISTLPFDMSSWWHYNRTLDRWFHDVNSKLVSRDSILSFDLLRGSVNGWTVRSLWPLLTILRVTKSLYVVITLLVSTRFRIEVFLIRLNIFSCSLHSFPIEVLGMTIL